MSASCYDIRRNRKVKRGEPVLGRNRQAPVAASEDHQRPAAIMSAYHLWLMLKQSVVEMTAGSPHEGADGQAGLANLPKYQVTTLPAAFGSPSPVSFETAHSMASSSFGIWMGRPT